MADHGESDDVFIPPSEGEVVVRLPKEAMKSVFYLFAGKPDSVIKVFPSRIVIGIDDLHELNARVQEKLDQHQIEGIIATANLRYDNNTVKGFGTWAEFESHRWIGAEVTQEVVLRWDFMVQLPNFKVPQRHTLTVRIAADFNPMRMFQMMLSKDPDDHSRVEFDMAPMFCRVDFINPLLSQELINIVDDWQKARRQPRELSKTVKFLQKHNASVHRAVHHSFTVMFGVLALGVLHYYTRGLELTAAPTLGDLVQLSTWLFGSFVLVGLVSAIGHWVAISASQSLESYGQYVTFQMTNGDRNRQEKLEERNRTSTRKFFGKLAGALAVNVLAGFFTYWLVS